MSQASKETITDHPSRPWVRFYARTIDYLLLGFFLKLIGADDLIPEVGFRDFIIPPLLVFAWIIPEASFLSLFGTTPGKWILRTDVADVFRLKPKFSSNLRRSLSVWCNGMGMGVLFIAPITAFLAYFRLKKRGRTLWDRDGRFSVKHRKIGAPRASIAFFSSAVLMVFLVFGPRIMIEACRQAVRIKPDDPKTHLNLGATYAKIGRFNEAIEAYKHAIMIKSDYAQAHYNLGRCHVELERYNEALEPFKKAVEIEPKNTDFLYALGVCYSRLDLPGDAVEVLNKVIEIKPNHIQALHELGVCYDRLGRYDMAIEASKKVIELKPEHVPALYNLGICYYRLSRADEAIESLSTALKIDPDFAGGHYHLGLCYIQLGRYKDAIEPFRKAIENKPDYAEAFYGLGVCHAKLHFSHDAVDDLKQAIRIKPDYAQAYHILGLTYLTIGEKRSALEQYQRLRTLDKGLAEELFEYIENMPALSGPDDESG